MDPPQATATLEMLLGSDHHTGRVEHINYTVLVIKYICTRTLPIIKTKDNLFFVEIIFR